MFLRVGLCGLQRGLGWPSGSKCGCQHLVCDGALSSTVQTRMRKGEERRLGQTLDSVSRRLYGARNDTKKMDEITSGHTHRVWRLVEKASETSVKISSTESVFGVSRTRAVKWDLNVHSRDETWTNRRVSIRDLMSHAVFSCAAVKAVGRKHNSRVFLANSDLIEFLMPGSDHLRVKSCARRYTLFVLKDVFTSNARASSGFNWSEYRASSQGPPGFEVKMPLSVFGAWEKEQPLSNSRWNV